MRYFQVTVWSAGYIKYDSDGEHYGFSAEEVDAGPDEYRWWRQGWVFVLDSGEVIFNNYVAKALFDPRYYTPQYKLGKARYFSLSDKYIDSSMVHHITYERRSEREQQVAERNADLYLWLQELANKAGDGSAVLGSYKVVRDKFCGDYIWWVYYQDGTHQSFATRVKAVAAVAADMDAVYGPETKIVLA